MNGEWLTPGGHPATFTYRERTNDWNVISSITTNDEYALPRGLSGWALDIGGHLGGVSIALALDNPGLRVLCVEPLPDNVALARLNIAANGLSERIEVIEGAAGSDGTIAWGGSGESEEHHAFVGNNQWALEAPEHHTTEARCYSLSAFMRKAKRVAFMKIDCEGCEWSFLADPAVSRVERLAGEWHPPGTRERLFALLNATHEVTWIGEHGFAAVAR